MVHESCYQSIQGGIFHVESRAFNAIANQCGSGLETGAASLFDVVAGHGCAVRPRADGSSAERPACRAGQGGRALRAFRAFGVCGKRDLRHLP